MMRIVWVVLAAALAWSVYWFVGSAALERGVRAAIDEMRASGWTVAFDDLAVHGFPNRFDTTIGEPRFTDPLTAITWEAPFVQFLALSYRPNRIIAILPDHQSLRGPFGAATIRSERARGSIALRPVPDLTLDHSRFVVETLSIESAGARLEMDKLLFATRLPPDRDDGTAQTIGLTIRDLDLPPNVTAAFDDPAEARLGYANLDATLVFDGPIDRHAPNREIHLTSIDVAALTVDWGAAALSASGSLEVGSDGLPTGTLDLELANWPAALDIATVIGLIAPDVAAGIRQGATLLSAFGDGSGSLDLPLGFRDGTMFLGPVPLGPAPRF